MNVQIEHEPLRKQASVASTVPCVVEIITTRLMTKLAREPDLRADTGHLG